MTSLELDTLRRLEDLADSQFSAFLERNRDSTLEASLVAESIPAQEINYTHNSIEFRSKDETYSHSVGILCRDADNTVVFGEPEELVRESFKALYYANIKGANYTFRHDDSYLLWEIFTQNGIMLPASNQDRRFKDVVAAEAHTVERADIKSLRIATDGNYC